MEKKKAFHFLLILLPIIPFIFTTYFLNWWRNELAHPKASTSDKFSKTLVEVLKAHTFPDRANILSGTAPKTGMF